MTSIIQMNPIFDCIVIGAGIAGTTASIYLKRAGLKILLLEKKAIGGQIINTSEIENYPTILSTDGFTFSNHLKKQLENLNIQIQYEEVIDIKNNEIKEVITNKNTYFTKNIIIATGRIPRKLQIEHADQLLGKGISYCATCDGFFYKNKDVAVLGGGNSSLEAAIYLSRLCHQVTIINRSDKLRADQELIQEVNQLENVKIIYNENIQSLESQEGYLSKIILNNEELKVEGLFVYIGLVPTLPFISHLNLNLEDGYIKVDSKMKTNLVGIYACGDIIKKDLYQIITASSEGAIAASNIK
ncbi:MAG: FAD-dependent oxidoreductase [Tenericutes bacterium]|nr:FAD-dependent oxidoreductase [Mycoplasmatota bacterium]